MENIKRGLDEMALLFDLLYLGVSTAFIAFLLMILEAFGVFLSKKAYKGKIKLGKVQTFICVGFMVLNTILAISFNNRERFMTPFAPQEDVKVILSGGQGTVATSENSGCTMLVEPMEEEENWGYQLTQYGEKYGSPVTGFATRQEAQVAAQKAVSLLAGGKYTTDRYDV